MTTKLGLCNEKTFIAMKNIHFKTVEEEEQFAIYIVTRITKVNYKLRVQLDLGRVLFPLYVVLRV